MRLSSFFKNTNSLDDNKERNLLFAPNYLIRQQKINDAIQYVFGGHSIITIEQKGSHKGLYFERTRISKGNKLTTDNSDQLHLGFQSIDDSNYLILGTRQKLTEVKPGDRFSISFKNEETLNFTLEAASDLAVKNKHYRCNLRTQITDEELQAFKTKSVQGYTLKIEASGSTIDETFDKEFSRKFREVAQSYFFCLYNNYNR